MIYLKATYRFKIDIHQYYIWILTTLHGCPSSCAAA